MNKNAFLQISHSISTPATAQHYDTFSPDKAVQIDARPEALSLARGETAQYATRNVVDV